MTSSGKRVYRSAFTLSTMPVSGCKKRDYQKEQAGSESTAKNGQFIRTWNNPLLNPQQPFGFKLCRIKMLYVIIVQRKCSALAPTEIGLSLAIGA